MVKELDLNSNGLCPHRFEPCRCRFLGPVSTAVLHTLSSYRCHNPNALEAAIAQLGERQTEDLEVPGSIPGLGTIFCEPYFLKMHFFAKIDLHKQKSEHPESNQGPFDICEFYSRTLYQLSYVRLRTKVTNP